MARGPRTGDVGDGEVKGWVEGGCGGDKGWAGSERAAGGGSLSQRHDDHPPVRVWLARGRREGRAERSVPGGGEERGRPFILEASPDLHCGERVTVTRWRGRRGRHCCGNGKLGRATGPMTHRTRPAPGGQAATPAAAGGPVGRGAGRQSRDGMNGTATTAQRDLRGGGGGGLEAAWGGSGLNFYSAHEGSPRRSLRGEYREPGERRRVAPERRRSARAPTIGGGERERRRRYPHPPSGHHGTRRVGGGGSVFFFLPDRSPRLSGALARLDVPAHTTSVPSAAVMIPPSARLGRES